MALHGKTTLRKLHLGLDEGETFRAGNVSGHPGKVSDTAWLPTEWREVYRRTATYTVLSYATPVAWRDAWGTWYVPRERYSVSTTGHQSAILYHLHGETVVRELGDVPVRDADGVPVR